MFKCKKGDSCISMDWKCDFDNDCLDKLDELNCGMYCFYNYYFFLFFYSFFVKFV